MRLMTCAKDPLPTLSGAISVSHKNSKMHVSKLRSTCVSLKECACGILEWPVCAVKIHRASTISFGVGSVPVHHAYSLNSRDDRVVSKSGLNITFYSQQESWARMDSIPCSSAKPPDFGDFVRQSTADHAGYTPMT